MDIHPKRQKRLNKQKRKRGSFKGRFKKRLPKGLLVLAVLAIIGMSAYDFFDLWAGRDTQPGEMHIVAELAQFLPSDNASLYVHEDRVYLSLNNQLRVFNLGQGHAPVTHMYHSLSQPILTGSGAYVVLWQPGVPQVYLAHAGGYRTLNVDPVLIAISPLGHLGVLSQQDVGEVVQVFDGAGQLLSRQYFSDATAIPLALALSEHDVAVGFMHIGGVGVSHSVAIFDFEQGLVASTGEQPGLVYGLILSETGLVIQTTLGDWLLDVSSGGELVQLDTDLRNLADRLGSVVVEQQSRQFVAYDEGLLDEAGNPIELWRFLSLPEPEALRFAGRIDQLVLRTNQRLYVVSR